VDEERSRAIGVWTAVAGGGGLLGMYLSAVLVDLASWRWLFVLPVALVVVAIGMTLRSVPELARRVRARVRHHRFAFVRDHRTASPTAGLAA
jgi:MFS family permease